MKHDGKDDEALEFTNCTNRYTTHAEMMVMVNNISEYSG